MMTLRLRLLAVLGKVSMYRLVLLALAALTLVALMLSLFGMIGPSPLSLLASISALALGVSAVDVAGHAVTRRAFRFESSLITALIMVFVLAPPSDFIGWLWLVLAGAAAAASKYVLVWHGRHIFNPAAFGIALVTLTWLGVSMWWIGTPVLAAVVAIGGLLIAWRTETVGIALTFVAVAVVSAWLRILVASNTFGLAFDPAVALSTALFSSPALFFGFFMLTEPLTLPPRRWQRYVIAALAGVLVGAPIVVGSFMLFPEAVLLLVNLLAFAFAARTRSTLRLQLCGRRLLTPHVTELTFRAPSPVTFAAGQYLELEVPHARVDARGTRREFSIVSAPGGDSVAVAFRTPRERTSSFKRALVALPDGATVVSTGVAGEFTAPRGPSVLIAAGIGITPFVSMARAGLDDATILVLASSASELMYLDDLAAAGLSGVVFTPDEPFGLPAGWTWSGGNRLDADALALAVPDLERRAAYVSGAPTLIADLTPHLSRARSVHTDAFSGY